MMSRTCHVAARATLAIAFFCVWAGLQATDSFTPTSHPLNTARSDHTATLLGNGKVLVAGGLNSTPASSASAETYDSAADTWTASVNVMVAARYGHAAALLPSGKVLLAGGYGSANLPIGSAELYDPAADTFTASAHMLNTTRAEMTATLLDNGKVLLVGGADVNGFPSAKAELYDPATDTFTNTAKPLLVARFGHSATLLASGKVLIAGGTAINGGATLAAELYDPVANTFKLTSKTMVVARTQHAAVRLVNGKVLVAAGIDSTGFANSSSELYDPAADKWTLSANIMTTGRVYHRMALLQSGSALVTGGDDNATTVPIASAEVYDPAADKWTATTSPMNATRAFHTSTLLNNGTVLIAAGASSAGNAQASSELYGASILGALALTSGPSATLSIAGTGETIAFSAVAAGGTGTLVYTWDFGDGSSDTGPSVTHAYVAAGNFTATVTVTDTANGSATGSVPITSTASAVTPLTISRASIKLNFSKSGTDSILFTGTIPIPAGFTPGGSSVQIAAGSVSASLILTAQGVAILDSNGLAIGLQTVNGATVAAATARYTALMKNGTFAAKLATSGLNNATLTKTPVNVTFSLVVNNTLFQTTRPMFYTAKMGKTGLAK